MRRRSWQREQPLDAATLARLARLAPNAADYIESRRLRGIPPHGQRLRRF